MAWIISAKLASLMVELEFYLNECLFLIIIYYY